MRVFLCAPILLATAAAAGIPLDNWKFSIDPDYIQSEGNLSPGPKGLILSYRFQHGGAVVATYTPPTPIPTKRKAAVSLQVRSAPDVKLTLLIKDKDQVLSRYPFEAITVEHPTPDWHQVTIPLSAKSTGYGDDDHNGAPRGRLTAIGILAEARYPRPMQGKVEFADVQILDSADQSFTLRPGVPLTPAPPSAAQLSPRIGVNIHNFDEHLLDQARDAGFSFVRADLQWRRIERNGQYRFFQYDRLLKNLEARHMGALFILDYGHPQHGGDPTRGPANIAAFARFAEAAAAHFKGRNVRFEVWNEPNIEQFWQPHPSSAEYAALLREAVAAIHRADPAAQVSTGGLAKTDLPFLAEIIATGAAKGVNAAAVHPYRKAAPEGFAAELPLFRQLLDRTLGPQVEIWDTEWGYASYDYFSKVVHREGHGAPGRKRQAVLAARELLTVWALGLPVAAWYDLRDDGDDPKNPEHNYGLLTAKNEDKPAMRAIRTLTTAAAARTYAGMIRDIPGGVHAMRLDGNGATIFVIWNDEPDAKLTLHFPTDHLVNATNLTGEPLKSKSEIALSETDGPIYLHYTR